MTEEGGYVSPEEIFERVHERAVYDQMDMQNTPEGVARIASEDDAAETYLREQSRDALAEAYLALMHRYIQAERKADRLERENDQ